MIRTFLRASFFLLTSFVCAAAPLSAFTDLERLASDPPKYHVEKITSAGQAYSVRMGGKVDGEMTRDPLGYWGYDQYWEPNLYVRLENVGSGPVVNPWLQRRDRPDTRSTASIVDFVLKPGMSEREKARALWEFEIKQRFHATTMPAFGAENERNYEVNDVVKRFNCYGYTLCQNESVVLSDLWRAAGLKVRRGWPNGHSTAEVFYDNAWHLLDSDESIICLMRDNRTIAGEEDIVADHDLMKRTHTYGPLHDENHNRDETSAALHYYEGERKGEHRSFTGHTMDFTLRPGESITWAWERGNRYHGDTNMRWNKRWRLFANVMNGSMDYSPDLGDPSNLRYLELRGAEYRSEGVFGAGLYAVEDSATVTVPVEAAYPIVGGRMEVDFGRRDQRRQRVKVSLSFDEGESWAFLWGGSHTDFTRMYVDIDSLFPLGSPARYAYLVRFDLVSELPGREVCLRGFNLHSTLQMARLALPGVSLGTNRFVYSDDGPAGRELRITHAWRECAADVVPRPPAGPVQPPDGGSSNGTLFTFRWQPPASGPAAADYEFQLSEYEDMRWVLSPNFHALVNRTEQRGTTSYELPCHGLLNPDRRYYWRVRARSDQGVWGPWSKVFSFTVEAPAVPVGVEAAFNRSSRLVTLSWQPGEGGSAPLRYRIYGSSERGFTACDTAYSIDAGLAGMRDCPANLLYETGGAATSWLVPPQLWRPYYRVAAIDGKGRESGPSAPAELEHPLIARTALPEARAGQYYEASVLVSASIGHLVSANEDGKPYQMRLRTGDELKFEIEGAPPGLAINRETGLIAGFLPEGAAGDYEVSVTATDEEKRTTDTVKLVLKVAGE